jgi:O-antigen ligase
MMDIFYILLTVVAVGLCFKGPRLGIAALAFILPISERLPGPPIPLLNSQNLVVLIALAVLLAKRKEPGSAGGVRFAIPLVAFVLLVTMGFANTMLFFAPVRFYVLWKPYEVMILYKNLVTCLLIYAIGGLVARSREDIETVFKGLMLGVAFEGAFICMEVVTKGPMRANGHLGEGNNAGAYLAGAVATALAAFLMLGWKHRAGLFGLGSALAAGVGLVFTLSRGSWLAGIIACGAIALLRDRRMLILIVLIVVSYQVWLPDKAMDRIDESFSSAAEEPWQWRSNEGSDEAEALAGFQSGLLGGGAEGEDGSSEARLDGSSQIRLYVWNAALRMLEANPLGVGYGVFPFFIGNYSTVIKFRAAHNSYLQIACELGIPGILMFLTFLVCVLYESLMVFLKQEEPFMRALGLAAFGAGIAMMVSAFFYNHFFLIDVNGQQWLLLGLATQVRRLKQPATTAPVVSPASVEVVPLYRMVK